MCMYVCMNIHVYVHVYICITKILVGILNNQGFPVQLWLCIRCNVLQCVAVCCSVLQCVVVCCGIRDSVCCSALQCVAVCCRVLQCVESDFRDHNTLQHIATHCNTLQHAATHCNTLQRDIWSGNHDCWVQHTLPRYSRKPYIFNTLPSFYTHTLYILYTTT